MTWQVARWQQGDRRQSRSVSMQMMHSASTVTRLWNLHTVPSLSYPAIPSPACLVSSSWAGAKLPVCARLGRRLTRPPSPLLEATARARALHLAPRSASVSTRGSGPDLGQEVSRGGGDLS